MCNMFLTPKLHDGSIQPGSAESGVTALAAKLHLTADAIGTD